MSDPTPATDATTKAPMRFRRTRIGVSVFFGLLTVALCVLWVRSYRASDDFHVPLTSGKALSIYSMRGGLSLHVYDGSTQTDNWDWSTGYPVDIPGMWDNYDRQMRPWRWVANGRAVEDTFVLPHWFPMLLTGILGIGVLLSFRFSLSTLLIATTLFAVVLGLAVWTSR